MKVFFKLLSRIVLLLLILPFFDTSVLAGVPGYLSTPQDVSCYKIVPATQGREEAIRRSAVCWSENSKQKLHRIANLKFSAQEVATLVLVQPNSLDTRCWRIGFHHLCKTSAKAVARIETDDAVFVKPEWKGNRLDWCLEWGRQCGKPAADAFCKQKGFSPSAKSFEIDRKIGNRSPTKVISTGKVCSRPSCDGFQVIVCRAQEISLE
ncbi:MAG: hypothetical protein ACRBBN_14610 [Methyloligellaceae bacterium]